MQSHRVWSDILKLAKSCSRPRWVNCLLANNFKCLVICFFFSSILEAKEHRKNIRKEKNKKQKRDSFSLPFISALLLFLANLLLLFFFYQKAFGKKKKKKKFARNHYSCDQLEPPAFHHRAQLVASQEIELLMGGGGGGGGLFYGRQEFFFFNYRYVSFYSFLKLC